MSSAPASAASAAPSPVQAAAQRPSEVSTDPYTREGAFFGSNIVNLPDGKPQRAGGVDFFIGHRFTQDVSSAGFGGLYGFDSSAIIAYGVRTGITNRITLACVMVTPLGVPVDPEVNRRCAGSPPPWSY